MRVCWLFFLTICPLFALSQPLVEMDTMVSYIYIGREQSKGTSLSPTRVEIKETINVRYPSARSDVFYRKMKILRIPLFASANRNLLTATTDKDIFQTKCPKIEGVVSCLLAGIKSGKIHALSPTNTNNIIPFETIEEKTRSYDGVGSPPVDTLAFNPFEEFGLKKPSSSQPPKAAFSSENLQQMLDLVVETGFSQRNSREYMHIHFIQILWFNPQQNFAPQILAVLPYPEVQAYFREMNIVNPYNESQKINVHDYLISGKFQAFVLKVD